MLVPLLNPRNYLLEVYPFLSFYHGWEQAHIFSRYGVIGKSSTFDEDIKVVLNYINGVLTDEDLVLYAGNTPYHDDRIDIQERELLLYALHQELERVILTLIPDFKYSKAIYLTRQNNHFYLVDLSRRIYVPQDVLYTHSKRTGQSLPVLCEPPWDNSDGFC